MGGQPDSIAEQQAGGQPMRKPRHIGRIKGVMHPRMKQRHGVKTQGRDKRAGRKRGQMRY